MSLGVTNNNLYAVSSQASYALSYQDAFSAAVGGVDMQSTLFMMSGGNPESVLDVIEVQTGISESLIDSKISFNKYVTAENERDNYLFQGTDNQLHNIDFKNGTYGSISETEFVAENFSGLLIDGEKGDLAYDVLSFGAGSAEFINYAATGYDDGCDTVEMASKDVASSAEGLKWGNNIKWAYKEVNPNNPSMSFISDVMRTSTQWLSSEEILDLQQETTYQSYIQKLLDIALKVMSANDEAGSTQADDELKDENNEDAA